MKEKLSWLDQQPPINTPQERVDWAIARIDKTLKMLAYHRERASAPFDILYEECEMLKSELETGRMIDRGL